VIAAQQIDLQKFALVCCHAGLGIYFIHMMPLSELANVHLLPKDKQQ
jgi:hypothetical protein